MKLLALGVAILLSTTAKNCSKKADAIPTCVQQKIDKIKSEPMWNPPAEVREYEYRGKKVYLFSSDCCDQFNTVYDDQCNYICAPSGGLTGRGDKKCEDFAANAKEIRLVWKDPRGK
jgi:hypothetical protein